MFEAFKNIKKESSNVYWDRTLDVLLDIGEFLVTVIGTILLFVACIVGVAVLVMIGFPIVIALSLLEWVLVPIPYYILTGNHYYDINDSLVTRYIDFIDGLDFLT